MEIIRYERHFEAVGFMRAIVFRQGDLYVAQCLEYDVAAEASRPEEVIKYLDLALEARFRTCTEQGKALHECIGPAPDHYRNLW